MLRPRLDQLKRKEVVVYANGFRYKGVLLEVTETEITLRAPTGFVSIAMDGISSVKEASTEVGQKESNKFVDPSFYNADEENEE